MKKVLAIFALLTLAGSLQAAHTQADITTLIQAILSNDMSQVRAVFCVHPNIIEDTIAELRNGSYTTNDIETVTKWLNTYRKDSNTAGCSHPTQLLERDELTRGSHRYH